MARAQPGLAGYADPDWEWSSAAEDSPELLHALWQDAVSRSRELLSETLADGGLGRRNAAGRTVVRPACGGSCCT
jgi:hypothetical protein